LDSKWTINPLETGPVESEIRRFLEALFSEKPSDLHILIWTLPDKRSYWFQSIGKAICFVDSLHHVDVYVGVGLAAKEYGPHNRCPADEIVGIHGVWVDIDLRSDAHPGSTLPGTIEEALSILPPELPPTFVNFTGNGIHAWWLFREPWIFQSDGERKQAAGLANRWNTLIRDNGRIKGLRIDRLKDLARVLRIPGTMNCKDPANPKSVVIHSCNDYRYNPSEFAEYLDDLGVSGDDADEAARKAWSKQFQDKPLKIDLAAEIPQTKLNAWIESDPRFKKTWFRQRSDMGDQTQSGYDLALADFGYRVGLSEQEIVDLLVQHRRIYRQKPRTTLDYFYRTLSKAAQLSANNGTFPSVSDPGAFDNGAERLDDMPIQEQPLQASPKSDREKIQLCKQISAAFEIEIVRIVKLSGKEPLYRMELAAGDIDFSSVGKLLNQKHVRESVAATAGRLIPRFKARPWEELQQMLLDACIEEDGGEELEAGGPARIYIAQYLADNTFIPTIEDQIAQNRRKPMMRHDRITICASDLQIYINRALQESVSVRAVVAMLSGTGAKSIRVRGKFKEQGRWELPVKEFDPQDYSPEGGAHVAAE
jgi:hypothetical protein